MVASSRAGSSASARAAELDRALKTAETVLRNLRVLATDQTVEKTVDENGKTEVTEFRTVTLEVTPKMAEKIAVAQTIGTESTTRTFVRMDSGQQGDF